MNAFDVEKLSSAIGRHLRGARSAVMQETRIHDAIAAALAELGITSEREFRLTAASRLDFWLPTHRLTIEVKKGAASLPVLRQIGRYFESAEVAGCILVAMRINPRVPASFNGKPIAHLPLWKYLL